MPNVLRTWARLRAVLCILLSALAVGCSAPRKGAVVFYCDGAGWYASRGKVKRGLRAGGYQGRFETFSWSAYLGPGPDHLITARSKPVARRLSRKIERTRQADPDSPIYVMGLSAGTAVVLSALEQLRGDVKVDHVVLFSPSVSAGRNLTPAMRHVRGYLYATSSPHDGILRTLVINADGGRGPPAGQVGFRLPRRAGKATRTAYQRVINLPWKPSYVAYDWKGGHTGAAGSKFVKSVIVPRLMGAGPYPLDRPLGSRASGG